MAQQKEARKFDKNKILTCVTADQAKVGSRGYFGDNLHGIKRRFETDTWENLAEVYDEYCDVRFKSESGSKWALFYPIEEKVE